MDVIDRINVLLKERGMSGAELSRKIGVSTAVYSQWNKKKTKPSNKNLLKAAEALNVPISELTGEKEKSPHQKEGGDESDLLNEIVAAVKKADHDTQMDIYEMIKIIMKREK